MNFGGQPSFPFQTQGEWTYQPFSFPFVPQYSLNYQNFAYSQNFMGFWPYPYVNNPLNYCIANPSNYQIPPASQYMQNLNDSLPVENLQQTQNAILPNEERMKKKEDPPIYKYFDPSKAPLLTSYRPMKFARQSADSDESQLKQNRSAKRKTRFSPKEEIAQNSPPKKRSSPGKQPDPQDQPFIIDKRSNLKPIKPRKQQQLATLNFIEKHTSHQIPREIDPLPILPIEQCLQSPKKAHASMKRHSKASEKKAAKKFSPVKYEHSVKSEEDLDNSQQKCIEVFDSQFDPEFLEDQDYQIQSVEKKNLRSSKMGMRPCKEF